MSKDDLGYDLGDSIPATLAAVNSQPLPMGARKMPLGTVCVLCNFAATEDEPVIRTATIEIGNGEQIPSMVVCRDSDACFARFSGRPVGRGLRP